MRTVSATNRISVGSMFSGWGVLEMVLASLEKQWNQVQPSNLQLEVGYGSGYNRFGNTHYDSWWGTSLWMDTKGLNANLWSRAPLDTATWSGRFSVNRPKYMFIIYKRFNGFLIGCHSRSYLMINIGSGEPVRVRMLLLLVHGCIIVMIRYYHSHGILSLLRWKRLVVDRNKQ